MRRTTLRLVFLVAVTASLSLYGLAGMQTASAATITVDTTADEFDSAPDTGCALREAIQAANTDDPFGDCTEGDGADTIVLPAGTYTLDREGTDDSNENGDLDIFDDGDFGSNDVTIQGAGAPTTIIVQTDDGERVIEIQPGGEFEVVISGVTVTGGDENDSGGGIDNDGQTLRLNGVHVTENFADSDGGGVNNDDNGVVVVKQSAFTLNSAGSEGGGVNTDDDAVTRLINVTVSGNEAESGGGGLSQTGDGVTDLQNVTVTGNIADSDENGFGNGGGIDQDGDAHNSIVTLRNTIVAGNSDLSDPADDEVAPDCEDIIVSQGHNLIGDVSGCAFADAGGDLVGTAAAPIDPLLGPLALNGGLTPNHELLAGSPAIDAGDPAGAPPIDQRGLPRDALPDIGAFEVQPPAAAPAAVTCKGKAATIVGTSAGDVLVGTAGRDVVSSLAGKDKVKTKGGKDLVCAGKGKDKVRGGGKKDTLLGQGGNDRLKGQGGPDKLKGGKGRDKCNGGPGIDTGNCEVETNIP
jgi:CSLREA domain-containing protein